MKLADSSYFGEIKYQKDKQFKCLTAICGSDTCRNVETKQKQHELKPRDTYVELYCVTRYSSQHTLEEQWNLCLIFGVLVDCNFLSFQSCFYRLLSAYFQKLLVIFAETLYNQWGLVELATAISPWAPFSTECPRFCNPFRSAAVHRGCFVRHLESRRTIS